VNESQRNAAAVPKTTHLPAAPRLFQTKACESGTMRCEEYIEQRIGEYAIERRIGEYAR
jgi:hypothetical protein